MFKKLILPLLIAVAITVPSCSQLHTNHARGWQDVIPDVQDSIAVIEMTIPEPKPICISVFNDCDVEEEPKDIPAGWGTGFVVRSDGYIATCFHVIFPTVLYKGAKILVKLNGKTYETKATYSYPLYDIVILKIDATNLNTLRLEDKLPRLGEPLLAAGWKYRSSITYVDGIVGSMYSYPDYILSQHTWIQTTLQIYPGFSGGPVFNRFGEVVGISNAYPENRPGYGFMIPISYLVSILEHDLIKDKVKDLIKWKELYDMFEKMEKEKQQEECK